MGWKGALRSIEASARRAERDSRRRHNDLLREQKQQHRMLERESAAFEVRMFESHIDLLRSIHKECGPVWDWSGVHSSPAPAPPTRTRARTEKAEAELRNLAPSIWDKVFGRLESKRHSLSAAVEQAQRADNSDYLISLDKHQTELDDWKEKHELAERILSGDIHAFKEVIEAIGPFREISDLGSTFEFCFKDALIIEVTLSVNGHEVIPSETKSLLQSGKLSTKKMPQSQFYELYQDYICGCVLRVSREIFALLPFEVAIVTAVGEVVNTQTGHLEEKPLLSVAIPRATLRTLNLNSIDPSESMRNFIHRMEFKKGKGFSVVDRIGPSMFSATPPS